MARQSQLKWQHLTTKCNGQARVLRDAASQVSVIRGRGGAAPSHTLSHSLVLPLHTFPYLHTIQTAVVHLWTLSASEIMPFSEEYQVNGMIVACFWGSDVARDASDMGRDAGSGFPLTAKVHIDVAEIVGTTGIFPENAQSLPENCCDYKCSGIYMFISWEKWHIFWKKFQGC